jgi:hypothetical protein
MSLYRYARNPNKRVIAEFILQRNGDKCSLAGPAMSCVRPWEIDHIDGNPDNWSPENLRLLCHAHNISERNRIAGQRSNDLVSVNTVREVESVIKPQWMSNEGLRHDYQRPKFNRWLYDPDVGLAHEEGARSHPKGLAKAAVHGVGLIQGKLGSSVTYERYVDEDINGGFWLYCKDGSDEIERTGKPFPFEPN